MSNKISSLNLPFKSTCDIQCIHVMVTDYKTTLAEFEEEVTKKSWVSKLKGISKISLSHNATKTLTKLQDEIFKKRTKLNVNVGEYLVSYSAQDALHEAYSHKKLPLAELIKERISGNAGFDFHTICPDHFLIFGEAKFSFKKTPRQKALKQIAEFIGDKDLSDLQPLEPFVKGKTAKNIEAGFRGYAAAFSYNDKSLNGTFIRASKSIYFKKIVKHKKLFLLAIEIC